MASRRGAAARLPEQSGRTAAGSLGAAFIYNQLGLKTRGAPREPLQPVPSARSPAAAAAPSVRRRPAPCGNGRRVSVAAVGTGSAAVPKGEARGLLCPSVARQPLCRQQHGGAQRYFSQLQSNPIMLLLCSCLASCKILLKRSR